MEHKPNITEYSYGNDPMDKICQRHGFTHYYDFLVQKGKIDTEEGGLAILSDKNKPVRDCMVEINEYLEEQYEKEEGGAV